MRHFLLTLAVLATSGAAAADQYSARYTPVVVQMQRTCSDYIQRKVNDGSKLAQSGLTVKRKTKKKTVYEGKAGLRANLDTVYSFELGENNRGVRGCRIAIARTDYTIARKVHGAALADMQKIGGKPVAAPKGGNSSYHRFAFGQTVIQVKSVFTANSLIMDYYIPR